MRARYKCVDRRRRDAGAIQMRWVLERVPGCASFATPCVKRQQLADRLTDQPIVYGSSSVSSSSMDRGRQLIPSWSQDTD
jgi:hypothetical protein